MERSNADEQAATSIVLAKGQQEKLQGREAPPCRHDGFAEKASWPPTRSLEDDEQQIVVFRSYGFAFRRDRFGNRVDYPYVVYTVAGLLQQVVNLVNKGYRLFYQGSIREGKDPLKTDLHMLATYEVIRSKYTRCRLKKEGQGSAQYLRFGNEWIMLMTEGLGPWFDEQIQRKRPNDLTGYPALHLHGHQIRHGWGDDRKKHTLVSISKPVLRDLEAYFLEMATKRSWTSLVNAFWDIPFEPYKPVRIQLLQLLHKVNFKRKCAGLPRVPASAIPKQRKIVRPFQEPSAVQ